MIYISFTAMKKLLVLLYLEALAELEVCSTGFGSSIGGASASGGGGALLIFLNILGFKCFGIFKFVFIYWFLWIREYCWLLGKGYNIHLLDFLNKFLWVVSLGNVFKNFWTLSRAVYLCFHWVTWKPVTNCRNERSSEAFFWVQHVVFLPLWLLINWEWVRKRPRGATQNLLFCNPGNFTAFLLVNYKRLHSSRLPYI